jgi:hypothetical protein
LYVRGYRNGKEYRYGSFPGLVTFRLVGPYLYGVFDSLSVCRWRELNIFRFLGRNWWLVIPGVQDPNSSPKPSVEWVTRVVHSTGGRIGTHMSLQVPPHDSVMRPWG